MTIITRIKALLKKTQLLLLEFSTSIKTFWWKLTDGTVPNPYSIPIIINNFNRLDSLAKLITSLEERGYRNIVILDNDSTYPPLLDFYKKTPYEVIYLHENIGFLALWKTDVYKRFKKSFYVYTDSDIILDEQCPNDFMSFFLSVLLKKSACMKVGFGIRIDNLPDCYREKESVISWERQYWTNRVDKYLFRARVDTTFALYRPYCKGGSSPHLVFRTDFPFVIQHLPWYQDTNNLSEEEKYYISHSKKATFWTGRLK